MKNYYVYIMANKKHGTTYVGVTNNLVRRVYEHKNDLVEGFTKKYRIHNLVYYEECGDITSAIEREKVLKKWKRKWKTDLIEDKNKEWRDLYQDIS